MAYGRISFSTCPSPFSPPTSPPGSVSSTGAVPTECSVSSCPSVWCQSSLFCFARTCVRRPTASTLPRRRGLTRTNGSSAPLSSSTRSFWSVLLSRFYFVRPRAYASAVGGWYNPSMSAMEVVGGVSFLLFCLWEWKFAPNPLLRPRIFNINYSLCIFTTVSYFLNPPPPPPRRVSLSSHGLFIP